VTPEGVEQIIIIHTEVRQEDEGAPKQQMLFTGDEVPYLPAPRLGTTH
jgi:hypothetical protein